MKLLPPSPRLAGRIADLSGLRCSNSPVTLFTFNRSQCSLRRTLSSDVTGSRTSTRCFNSSSTTTTKTDAPPPPSLPDQVRLLMRRVPYPVAIITSTDPSEPSTTNTNTPPAFRGMTVSSFNTVTLRPDPIISFNVRRPSETLSALQSSGRFLVHLLSAEEAPASLARDFSRGNHNLAIASGEGEFEFVPYTPTPTPTPTRTPTPSSDSESRESRASALPLPLLRRKTKTKTKTKEAFPFVLECLLHPQNVTVADHTIVVGTVIRAISSPSGSDTHGRDAGDSNKTPSSSSAGELCLTYADTRFWKMGEEI